jgi:hypothetical protein
MASRKLEMQILSSDITVHQDDGLFAVNASPCRLVSLRRHGKETLSCDEIRAPKKA